MTHEPASWRPVPSGAQYRIGRGIEHATVTEVGAAVREYRAGARETFQSYPEHDASWAFHGSVLLPWPNRVRDGRYTGKVSGTPNMREGKIERLEAWLAQRGGSLAGFRQSWFYSDSRNDIPLLSRVSHPVAVNADATLAALASERGWATLSIPQCPTAIR